MDTGPARSTATGHLAILCILLLAGLALRISTFGDTNLSPDDGLYFLVGQRMHDGVLPYVDAWDRKPLGLFIIYYLIAAVSTAVVAYQIAAWLFAAATAFVIHLILSRLSNRQGGLLAGIIYLLAICPLGGYGGQSPVFYNLLIAAAACLILGNFARLAEGRAGWRIWTAMALGGLALTVKQTTFFECVFFGCYVLIALYRAGVPLPSIARQGAGFAVTGALPTLAIAAFYGASGHWPEYWQAMVTSNLRPLPAQANVWSQVEGTGVQVAALVMAAVAALATMDAAKPRRFLVGWLVAALFGYLSVPNFFHHYFLPMLVPLSVAAGLLFARGGVGRVTFVATLFYTLLWYDPSDFDRTRASERSMQVMAEAIRRHGQGGDLFVYDGPPYLYALTGKRFLSPLVFPDHLNHAPERNVGHLRTDAEIDRILALQPRAVVFSFEPRNKPVNPYGFARVRAYVLANCRLVAKETSYAMRLDFPIAVFGDCRPRPRQQATGFPATAR
jgi:hypothetical protein